MTESSAQRFRRLAEKRVVRTIKEIRLIGNLANRSNYSYSRAEVERIFRALEKELKISRARFDIVSDRDDAAFTLSDESNG